MEAQKSLFVFKRTRESSFIKERDETRCRYACPMSRELQQKVGHIIRDTRMTQGITQSMFALMVGFTKSYLSEIEAGKKNVTLRTLEKIAESLDVSPRDLLPRD